MIKGVEVLYMLYVLFAAFSKHFGEAYFNSVEIHIYSTYQYMQKTKRRAGRRSIRDAPDI